MSDCHYCSIPFPPLRLVSNEWWMRRDIDLDRANEALELRNLRLPMRDRPFNLEHSRDFIKQSKSRVMAAVKGDGELLQFGSDALRNDPEVVLMAIKQNAASIRFASDDLLRSSSDLWEAAIDINPSVVFNENPWSTRTNYRDIHYALKRNPHVYQHLSPYWMTQYDIALHAVRLCWRNISHVPHPLNNDMVILKAMISHKNWHWREDDLVDWYHWRNNMEMMSHGAMKDYEFMTEASKSIQRNVHLCARVAKKFPCFISHDACGQSEDINVILSAVRQNGMALKHVRHFNRLTDIDMAIVLSAVSNNGMGLQFAPDFHRRDRTVVITALANNGMALQFVDNEELRSDSNINIVALMSDGMSLSYAKDSIKSNREMAMIAVGSNGLSLKYTTDDHKNDVDIVALAVNNDPKAMTYASSDVKGNIDLILLMFDLIISDGVLLEKYRKASFTDWINLSVLTTNLNEELPEGNHRYPYDHTFAKILCGLIICAKGGYDLNDFNLLHSFTALNVDRFITIFQQIAMQAMNNKRRRIVN
jgi:hypothetical protein